MKRIFCLIMAILLGAVCLPAQSQDLKNEDNQPATESETLLAKPAKSKLKIGLRLYGGMNFLDGGDINDTNGYIDFYSYQSELHGFPFTIDAGGLNRCLEGGADLLVYLGERFGVSLGAAYLKGSRENLLTLTVPESPPVTATFRCEPQIESIPVNLGLFYILPLGGRFNLLADAGGGWTFAWLKIIDRFEMPDGSDQSLAKGDAGGIHGFARLALEVKIRRGLFFFVEAVGRYARISGFKGSQEMYENDVLTSTTYGTFHTVTWGNPGPEFRVIQIKQETPFGLEKIDSTKTVIDYSGVSARAGVRIRF